jgi:hypothetical protein
MTYRTKEFIPEVYPTDSYVTARKKESPTESYTCYYDNCILKPRQWLGIFIQLYLAYSDVKGFASPTNYELLEVANESWEHFSHKPFEIQDISLVLKYLENKEIIANQAGYQLQASKPLPLLSAISNLLNKKIF